MNKRCCDCRHYHISLESRQGNAKGECRLDPPTVTSICVGIDQHRGPQIIHVSKFPDVQENYYCGQFELEIKGDVN